MRQASPTVQNRSCMFAARYMGLAGRIAPLILTAAVLSKLTVKGDRLRWLLCVRLMKDCILSPLYCTTSVPNWSVLQPDIGSAASLPICRSSLTVFHQQIAQLRTVTQCEFPIATWPSELPSPGSNFSACSGSRTCDSCIHLADLSYLSVCMNS